MSSVVAIRDLATGEVTELDLTRTAIVGEDGRFTDLAHPRWSPDGSTIAFHVLVRDAGEQPVDGEVRSSTSTGPTFTACLRRASRPPTPSGRLMAPRSCSRPRRSTIGPVARGTATTSTRSALTALTCGSSTPKEPLARQPGRPTETRFSTCPATRRPSQPRTFSSWIATARTRGSSPTSPTAVAGIRPSSRPPDFHRGDFR